MTDTSPDEAVHARRRRDMVEDQLMRRGISDPEVLRAMATVPRHAFVLDRDRDAAYEDCPIPIGYGQTISQPYIVALMSELAEVRPGSRVLDVGTGSGYQAAVLAELRAEVHSVEILAKHAERATSRFQSLGLEIPVHCRDGSRGLPEHAPYDAILVAAAPRQVPQPLLDQLEVGGRLILPVGDIEQELLYIVRTPHGWTRKRVTSVAFVPMTGEPEGQKTT